MSAFRKLILTEVEKGNRARLMHAKRFTDKEMKCIVRIIEARPSLALKTQEIKFLIRMEGPSGIELKMAKIITPLMEGPTSVELKKTGIVVPLMEGPTGLPVCEKMRRHAHIINRSHGKRRVQKTESRKIY